MNNLYSESVRINNIPKYAGVQWDLLIMLQKASDQIGRIANLTVPWEAKASNTGKWTDEKDTVAYVQLEDAALHDKLCERFENVLFVSSKIKNWPARMHCKHLNFIPERFHEIVLQSNTNYREAYNEDKYRIEQYTVITNKDESLESLVSSTKDVESTSTQCEITMPKCLNQEEEEDKTTVKIECSAGCRKACQVKELQILQCGHTVCENCITDSKLPVANTYYVVCAKCRATSKPYKFKVN